MSTTTHRASTGARPGSRGRLAAFAAIAAAAIAGAALLVAFQSTGSPAATVPVRTTSGEGRTLGDANAPVTVIEYADFQWPICKRAESAVLSPLEQQYVQQGTVKIEFRNFPIIGPESMTAAQAALAAADQGKFWEYHDALFNTQGAENSGAFSYDKLVGIARQVGLDVPKFEQALSSNAHLAEVQAEANAAQAAGVTATPTFFVGNAKIVGLQPYSQFQAAIDAALAAS